MGMHQSMKEEINDLYNAELGRGTWHDNNVLAGINIALEDLWDLYERFATGTSSPAGTYGVTPLKRA